MEKFVNYIIEAGLSLGIFTLVYWFLLRKETLFKASRVYLLLALMFSTLVPFFHIAVIKVDASQLNAQHATNGLLSTNVLESVTVYASGLSSTVGQWLLSFNYSVLFYAFGALAALIIITIGLMQLYSVTTKNRVYRLKSARLVVSRKKCAPYSFFNFIFIDAELTTKKHWKSIVQHELEHLKQGHSYDVLFVDLMMIFQWFNPFYWGLRYLVRENHEFLADNAVLARGRISRGNYKALLLSQVIGGRPVMTSNFFNVKTIKKRFKMITDNKPGQWAIAKYAASVIAAVLITMLFACEKTSDFEKSNPQGGVVFNGELITSDVLMDKGVENLIVRKVNRLDALLLYPELENQLGEGEITLVFDAKNREQMVKAYQLDVKAIPDELKNNLNGIEVLGYAKNALDSKEAVFTMVEDMPEFTGGEMALRKWIATNVEYPKPAAEYGIKGKVFVSFVVSKDGSVKNVRIARGVDPLLDAEAIRVVSKMPAWKPGKQRGEKVNVEYTIPINFQLQ